MVSEEFRVDGTVAIVTGAGRGIGRSVAYALAEMGADVTVCARSVSEIEETAHGISQGGRRALPVRVDVTQRDQVDSMVARTVRELGRVDILVNNVGVAVVKPFLESSVEDWEAQIGPNLYGMFFCTQAVGRHLVAQRSGKVVNISSIAGLAGKTGMTCYGATKAGVIQFTRVLAVEWAPYHINVNCVIPGAFHTQPIAHILDDPVVGPIRRKKIPLRRAGDPHELAATVVYFASAASAFVTGTALAVDGGETAKL